MSSPVSYDLQGQGGGVVLGGDDTATNVRWIQCLNDCVFSAFTIPSISNVSNMISVTIPAGVGIGGRIDSVTLSSGVAIAYYR
jgi:hypothetical protein